VVDSSVEDPVEAVIRHSNGGSQGVLCLATTASAFEQAIKMARRKGLLLLLFFFNLIMFFLFKDIFRI
jgi:hypothetical protein